MVVDDSAAVRALLIRLLRDIEGVELVVETDDTVKAVHISRVMSGRSLRSAVSRARSRPLLR